MNFHFKILVQKILNVRAYLHRYLERGEAAPELIQGSVRPRFHYGNPALEFPTIDPTAAESGAEARPSFPCMFFPSRDAADMLC